MKVFRAEKISVVIPARNEAASISSTVAAVLGQEINGAELEVIVVDDGSIDGTAALAEKAGARTLALQNGVHGGNPAAARNHGARIANGDTLVFLDADCTPAAGWLNTMMRGHAEGATCVGGALAMPEGLSLTARADYYSSWYHFHEKRPRAYVHQLPPCNLSVPKEVFLSTDGFNEEQPICYSHEELVWQAQLAGRGARFLFEPKAMVYHRNRKGFGNLLRRNYRWAYSAIEGKAGMKITRWPWLYRFPLLAALASVPSIPLQVIYITSGWLRYGKWEPLMLLPWICVARTAYGAGMLIGGINRPGRRKDAMVKQPGHRFCGLSEPGSIDRFNPVRLAAAVCTRNRPAKLERALKSLLTQKDHPALLEIIVVDNAPADDVVKELVQKRFSGVRYVREHRPGLNVARNRALREASAAFVAYLDDDAVADDGWIAAYAKVFEEYHDVALCTGRVEALSTDTPAQRLFEANGGFGRGNRPVELPKDAHRLLHGRKAPLIAWVVSVGNGCSFAVRREVVLAIGGFDEGLDRGPDLPGGGDLDMFWRVLQSGCSLRYEPLASARHEHRSTMAEVSSQLAGHQRALIAWLTKCLIDTRGKKRPSVLLFLVWRLLKPGVRLVRRSFGRDPLPHGMLLRIWGNCWLGLAAYAKIKRHTRRNPAVGPIGNVSP